MIELRDALSELEAAIPPAPEDFESVRRVGAKRLLRQRLLGGSALALVAAGLFFAASSIVTPMPEEDTLEAAGPRTSWGAWTETASAPIEARSDAAAVWTGEEILLWGGQRDGSIESDGAAFSPERDKWRVLSDAPLVGAVGRTAVWTGREMILWGGESSGGSHGSPDDGARYNPSADRWKKLPRSPIGSLGGHRAVWTGSEMLVWGGVNNFGSGASFDPATNEWRTLPEAPVDGRTDHVAVWSGEEMIVWGGVGEFAELLTDGAAYDPIAGTWRVLEEGPLSPRTSAGAAWTGEEMIVWGGSSGGPGEDSIALSDGAAYDPETDTWRSIADAPAASDYIGSPVFSALDTVIVFGAEGEPYAYDPASDEWSELSGHASLPRRGMTALNAGSALFLWGGTSLDSSPADAKAIVMEGRRG